VCVFSLLPRQPFPACLFPTTAGGPSPPHLFLKTAGHDIQMSTQHAICLPRLSLKRLPKLEDCTSNGGSIYRKIIDIFRNFDIIQTKFHSHGNFIKKKFT